jgi:hypothetical protein
METFVNSKTWPVSPCPLTTARFDDIFSLKTHKGGYMTKLRFIGHAAAIILAGFLFQSYASVNVRDLFISNPQQLLAQKHARYQQATRPHAAGLAKRTAPGTGTISGKVINADSSNHAIQWVGVVDTFGCQVGTTYCDLAGAYTLSGLYPGEYLLMSDPSSYAYYYFLPDPNRTYFGNTTDRSKGVWLHLSAGQSLTGRDITIASDSALPKSGIVISGTCYMGPGTSQVLGGVSLTFLFVSSDSSRSIASYYSTNSAGWCYTNPDGSFRCSTSVVPQNYYVLIKMSGPSNSRAPQWWDGSSIFSEPVAVAIPASVSGKAIHFDLGGSISGSVKDGALDTLAQSVTVDVIDNNGLIINSDYLGGMTTAFTIDQLPPGSYFLKASDNSDFYLPTYYSHVSTRDSATSISIAAGSNVQNIALTLQRNPGYSQPSTGPTGIIKGKVTRFDNGVAIPYMNVNATTTWMNSVGSMTCDSMGNYVDSVPIGSSYLVSAGPTMLSSMYGITTDYYLAQTWYAGTTDMSAATAIAVVAGATKVVDIAMQQGGSIGGWLRTANNLLFPGIYTALYYGRTAIYGYAWTEDFKNIYICGATDFSGFRFCGVNPGTYTLRFISYASDIYGDAIGETDYGYGSARGVAVTKENTSFNQVAVLPDGSAHITGALAADLGQNSAISGEYFYCYSADSIIAGMAQTSDGAVSSSKRSLFFSRDYSPLSSGAQNMTYSLGKLVPGKYAVAHLTMQPPDTNIIREWYPGAQAEKIDIHDYSAYMKQILKPDIPSTAWITLAAGETKSGINFGNAGVIPRELAAGTRPDLRLLNNTAQNRIIIHYRLGTFDKSTTGTLSIYRLNGARVRTLALSKPEGIIAWDGRNEHSAPVTAGVYVYRLTCAGRAVTVKGAWVR